MALCWKYADKACRKHQQPTAGACWNIACHLDKFRLEGRQKRRSCYICSSCPELKRPSSALAGATSGAAAKHGSRLPCTARLKAFTLHPQQLIKTSILLRWASIRGSTTIHRTTQVLVMVRQRSCL